METIVIIDDDFTVEVISDDEENDNNQEQNKGQLDWDMENNSDFELGKHVNIKEEIDIDDEYHYLMCNEYVDLMQIKTEIQSDSEENEICFEENCLVEETFSNLDENPPVTNPASETPPNQSFEDESPPNETPQNIAEENSVSFEDNTKPNVTPEALPSEEPQTPTPEEGSVNSEEIESLPTPQIEEHHNEKEISSPQSPNESLKENPEKLPTTNEPIKDPVPAVSNTTPEKENSNKQIQKTVTPVKEKKLENSVVEFSKKPLDRRESEWKGKSKKTPEHRHDKSVVPYKARWQRDRRPQNYRNRQVERFNNKTKFSGERYRHSKFGQNYHENQVDPRPWNNYNSNNMPPPPMDGVRNQIYNTILNALNQLMQQNQQSQVRCNPSVRNRNYQFSKFQQHQFGYRQNMRRQNFMNNQFQCSTNMQTYTTILQAVTQLNHGVVRQNCQNVVTQLNDFRLQMSVSNVFRSV